MHSREELYFALNQTIVRGVSLHAWPEHLALTDCSEILASSLDLLGPWPVKVGISQDIMKRTVVRKWKSASDVDLSEFNFIESLGVEAQERLSKASFDKHLVLLGVSQALKGEIYFQHLPSILTIDLGIRFIRNWLEVVTPRYGFSTMLRRSKSGSFHSGTPNLSDEDERHVERVRAYEQARYCEPHEDGFLGNRLLDVFEMNILSPAHLASRVFGTTLCDWISKGDRGELKQLKEDVHAWIVADTIREDVRQSLLRAKHLVVPV